jgi:alpha-1,2-mannosyltransferase
VVLALAWQPTLAATRHGQVSAVISALLIGAWALARRGRDIAAGAAVGVAAALKVYPVIFLLFFLVRRPRACAVAAATLLSTTALVIAIAGLANLRAYMVSASAIAARYGTTGNNYSLVSRLGLIGLGQSPWPAIAAAVLLLATLAALLAVRDDGQHTFDHEAAACVCLVLLASPIAWQHYFFVLLLPVFVAGRAAYRHGSRWSLGLWLAGLLAISVPDAPYWWVVTHVAPRIPPAALLLSPTIAMLAAWAWGLRRVDYA